jgi:hypothetical protein
MRDLFFVLGHLLNTVAKILRPGGAKAGAPEGVLLKQEVRSVEQSRGCRAQLKGNPPGWVGRTPPRGLLAAHGCLIWNSPCTGSFRRAYKGDRKQASHLQHSNEQAIWEGRPA